MDLPSRDGFAVKGWICRQGMDLPSRDEFKSGPVTPVSHHLFIASRDVKHNPYTPESFYHMCMQPSHFLELLA